MGVGKGVVFLESFVCRLFCISRHARLVITAIDADEMNPVRNTDNRTMIRRKCMVQQKQFLTIKYIHISNDLVGHWKTHYNNKLSVKYVRCT